MIPPEELERLEGLLEAQGWARDWQFNIVPPGKPAHELACSAVRALRSLIESARRLREYESQMPTIWEDPAGKGYPCFERPMTPAECKTTIDKWGLELAAAKQSIHDAVQAEREACLKVFNYSRAELEPFVHAAAVAWCGEKERETSSDDIAYFVASWHSLPGLKNRVIATAIRSRGQSR